MNYYKWFPTAKVVFLAPTSRFHFTINTQSWCVEEPLVDQQAKACHDVCGIPQADVAVLYGDVPQHKRENIVRNLCFNSVI